MHKGEQYLTIRPVLCFNHPYSKTAKIPSGTLVTVTRGISREVGIVVDEEGWEAVVNRELDLEPVEMMKEWSGQLDLLAVEGSGK